MVIEILDKLHNRYKKYGAKNVAIWLADEALKNLKAALCSHTTCYVIERPLDGRIPDVHAKIPVEFIYGSIADLVSFHAIRKPWRRYHRIFEDRFLRSQICIMAFQEKKLIGYLWFTDKPETDRNLGFTIRPAEHESYGFDLYVLPEYRKDLVGIELISRWLRHAHAAGKRKAIGVVASHNQPMLMTTKVVFGFVKRREIQSIELFKSRGFVIAEKNYS